MSLLAGRRAVVTGGARGLGAAVVERFAAEGATGVVLDLDAPAEPLPAGWDHVQVDVRDDAALAEEIAGAGRVDVLVTAAGVVPGWAGLADTDPATWDEVLEVNARGTWSAIRHAVPAMGVGGAVVAIASLNAWRGDANLASYAASKHAVLGLVRSAAAEHGPRGIRVNAVAPGPVATRAMLDRMGRRERERGIAVAAALAAAAAQCALRRMATVEEVAAATLFLASPLSSGTTGHLLPVDGGLL